MSKALILIFLLVFPIPAEAGIKYFIEATFDPETNSIHGSLRASIDGLKEPLLILYPNIYLKEGPKESYPRRFNPGSITILSITDGDGNPLELRPVSSSEFEIRSSELSDKHLSMIKIEFLTKIPEKLGLFGYHDGITTLQGGWHPIISPSHDGELPVSDYIIRIEIPIPYTILHTGSRTKEEEDAGKRIIEFEAVSIKSPTMVISKRFVNLETTIGDTPFDSYFLEKDKWYIERALETIRSAVDFFERNFPKPRIKTIRTGEVYLYSDMAVSGEDVILLNNRFFKVYPYLRRFHEAQLIKSLYTIYWRDILNDEDWVSEGMAEYSMELYLQERYPERPDLAKAIKTFSFIPAVDEVLYSPRLPFRRTYFFTEGFEGQREDIRLFNNNRFEGGRVFSKLRNLVGEESFKEVIEKYIRSFDKSQDRPSKPFREISSEVCKRDLSWFYYQWLKGIPRTDYYLKEIKEIEQEDLYLTEITVGKRGKAIEPVEVYTRDGRYQEDTAIWDGEGDEFVMKRYTLSPIKVIEIDPEKKLEDYNRYNNRTPPRWKFLLHRFRLSYDFQTDAIEGDMQVSFQRFYDLKNRFIFNYYHRLELDGLRIGYDYRWDNKNLSFFLGFERLSGEFSRLGGGRYIVSPYLAYRHGGIEIGLESSSKSIGSDYSYQKLQLTAIKEFRIANKESIALRAILGQSEGKMPEHKLFFLGGITGARGFSKAEDKGENIALFTAEYRFPLIYDLDKNLFDLITVHTLQVALFADTGMVSDKRDTFRFHEYKHDVGIGFRFHANLFGIYPGIGRVDIAMPVGPDVRHRPAYYLSIGQSF
jgi:hypothetical protein